jgi:uncharacterized SAM-binding protein YcdF (DUF218 family)
MALLVAILALAAGQLGALFVWPPQPAMHARYDAIVVLSGDHGDRFTLGRRFAVAHKAPVLVVLRPEDGPSAVTRPLCGQRRPFAVLCVDPPIVSTNGDIASTDELARREGWRRVLVVTSRFHVTRARLILDRCSGLDASVVGSDPRFGWREWRGVVAHEALGVAQVGVSFQCAR